MLVQALSNAGVLSLAALILMVLGQRFDLGLRSALHRLLLGIIFGTYSTIYVASPTILVMQDLKPYLNRLIPDFARNTAGEEGAEDDGAAVAALTASEQRRRERAEKARGSGPA